MGMSLRRGHDFKTGADVEPPDPAQQACPTQLKIPKSEVGKHEYHSMQTIVLYDSIFELAVWISVLDLPLTGHNLDSTVQRLRKKPGKKSTNAKAAREAFEPDEYEKEIPQVLYGFGSLVNSGRVES
jgi:hypothetical protein